VPWRDLTLSDGGETVIANVTKDQLEAMPEYNPPGETEDASHEAAGSAETSAPRHAGSATVEEAPTSGQSEQMSEPAEALVQPAAGEATGMRASDLVGVDVKDPDGESIGEIDELLLGENGAVMGIVIDGKGDPRVVSWDDVSLTATEEEVQATTVLTEDLFEKRPIFNEEAATP
jgi:hypothetical protein